MMTEATEQARQAIEADLVLVEYDRRITELERELAEERKSRQSWLDLLRKNRLRAERKLL